MAKINTSGKIICQNDSRYVIKEGQKYEDPSNISDVISILLYKNIIISLNYSYFEVK